MPSLAYRKNARDIWVGRVPEKYTRLIPFITGRTVLEIGSAEGVLCLMLARDGRRVIGVELRPDRHEVALALKRKWCDREPHMGPCRLVCADIRDCLYLLRRVDTVVAVRSIYYLREDVELVLREIAKHVSEVVLCGNPHRWPKCRNDVARLGEFNRYASLEGMRELLEASGYNIAAEVAEGDPIVVGRRDIGSAAQHPREDIA